MLGSATASTRPSRGFVPIPQACPVRRSWSFPVFPLASFDLERLLGLKNSGSLNTPPGSSTGLHGQSEDSEVDWDDRFQMLTPVARGGFGRVYSAVDSRRRKAFLRRAENAHHDDHDGAANRGPEDDVEDPGNRWAGEVAIKMESIASRHALLLEEARTLLRLQGLVGVPRLYGYGVQCIHNVLVMELVGPSIDKMLARHPELFDTKTWVLLGIQITRILEGVHRYGFVHRDIKPRNFAITFPALHALQEAAREKIKARTTYYGSSSLLADLDEVRNDLPAGRAGRSPSGGGTGGARRGPASQKRASFRESRSGSLAQSTANFRVGTKGWGYSYGKCIVLLDYGLAKEVDPEPEREYVPPRENMISAVGEHQPLAGGREGIGKNKKPPHLSDEEVLSRMRSSPVEHGPGRGVSTASLDYGATPLGQGRYARNINMSGAAPGVLNAVGGRNGAVGTARINSRDVQVFSPPTRAGIVDDERGFQDNHDHSGGEMSLPARTSDSRTLQRQSPLPYGRRTRAVQQGPAAELRDEEQSANMERGSGTAGSFDGDYNLSEAGSTGTRTRGHDSLVHLRSANRPVSEEDATALKSANGSVLASTSATNGRSVAKDTGDSIPGTAAGPPPTTLLTRSSGKKLGAASSGSGLMLSPVSRASSNVAGAGVVNPLVQQPPAPPRDRDPHAGSQRHHQASLRDCALEMVQGMSSEYVVELLTRGALLESFVAWGVREGLTLGIEPPLLVQRRSSASAVLELDDRPLVLPPQQAVAAGRSGRSKEFDNSYGGGGSWTPLAANQIVNPNRAPKGDVPLHVQQPMNNDDTMTLMREDFDMQFPPVNGPITRRQRSVENMTSFMAAAGGGCVTTLQARFGAGALQHGLEQALGAPLAGLHRPRGDWFKDVRPQDIILQTLAFDGGAAARGAPSWSGDHTTVGAACRRNTKRSKTTTKNLKTPAQEVLDQLSFVGTIEYASPRAHVEAMGKHLDEIDDLYGLGYTMVALLNGGRLPWSRRVDLTKYEKEIGERKTKIPHAELCSGCPVKFQKFFQLLEELREKDSKRRKRNYEQSRERCSSQAGPGQEPPGGIALQTYNPYSNKDELYLGLVSLADDINKAQDFGPVATVAKNTSKAVPLVPGGTTGKGKPKAKPPAADEWSEKMDVVPEFLFNTAPEGSFTSRLGIDYQKIRQLFLEIADEEEVSLADIGYFWDRTHSTEADSRTLKNCGGKNRYPKALSTLEQRRRFR